MAREDEYFKQVQLLVRLLPHVAKEECFALKGGTAINLFVRNLPRLSVDIDLAYLPLEPREPALANIRLALAATQKSIEEAMPDVRVHMPGGGDDSLRLVVQSVDCHVKIELSPVLRGTVLPPEIRQVHEKVEEDFGFAEMQVLSFADLYAGKLCAALDRQHPRDLFDIKLLLEAEGLTRELAKTFIVYLISHHRPIAELLTPNKKDISGIFETEFETMTRVPVTLEELVEIQKNLSQMVRDSLNEQDRRFLLSFKAREPVWSLLGIEGIQDLPAVQWKLINLNKMLDAKHQESLKNLEAVLFEG